ncbi:hypothetical protein Hanom_Chr11g00998221 [Helianthus anomalus]
MARLELYEASMFQINRDMQSILHPPKNLFCFFARSFLLCILLFITCEKSGVPDSNEQEEVVSTVQGKQNRPFLDLNMHPLVNETSPVNDSYHAGEPSYPTQQGYPNYGYGCEYSYVQQHYPDGYGGDDSHQQFISPNGPYIQQNYPDVGGYGGEALTSQRIRT